MLKAGVIGVGQSNDAGTRRGRALAAMLDRHPQVQVTAACDIDESALQETRARFGIETLYTDYRNLLQEDIDIVVVASPPHCHAEQAIAAMEAGKHVLSEVPACVTLDECQALAETARRTGSRYMLAENFRFLAYIDTWKRMAADGRLGKIVYAEGEYIHDCRRWMLDSNGAKTWRVGLPPIHYCTHSLGPLLYLMEDRCESVSCLSSGVNVAPEIGANDMQVAIFRTSGGAAVKILCGFSVVREPVLYYYSLYGTKGCVENSRCGWDSPKGYFEDVPNLHDMIRLPLDNIHVGAPPDAAAGGYGTSEYYMIKAYVESILNDSQPPIDFYDALDYTAPGICANLSAQKDGETVQIPDYRRPIL